MSEDLRRCVLVIGGASFNQVIHLGEKSLASPATVFATDTYKVPGGTGLGKAVNLSALGHRVVFQTAMGRDPAADEVRSYLKMFDLEFLDELSDQATEQHVNIMLANDQRISIYTAPPPASTAVQMDQTLKAMSEASIIAPSILPYVKDLLPAAQSFNAPIWVDLHNYDGSDPYHRPFIDAADVLFVSCERLSDPEAFIQSQIDDGKAFVVATDGKRGAICMDQAGRWYEQGAISVDQVIDTNGAGDAFFAGFAHAYLNSDVIDACMTAGAQMGARAVQSKLPHALSPKSDSRFAVTPMES